jgi:group I intron endonuclease
MKAIYKILNNKNGKFYIGSAKNLRNRWKRHRWELNKGQHHSSHLQRAWNKHGKENFTFIVLEEVAREEDLIPAEQKWLDQTRSYDREIGYNTNPTAGSWLGTKHTDEAKKRMSAARKGKKATSEAKRRMSEAAKGRSKSEEHRRKIREANSGEKGSGAKLTWEEVREMRAIYDRGEMGQAALARRFAVGDTAAHNVVKRKTWINDPNERD